MISIGKVLMIMVLSLIIGLFTLKIQETNANDLPFVNILIYPEMDECAVGVIGIPLPIAYARATNTAFIGDPYTKINSTCHLNLKDFVPTPDSALVLEDGIISCKIKVDEMCYGRMCFPVYETAQSVKVVITPSGKVNVSCKYEEEDEM